MNWFENSITMHILLDRYAGCQPGRGDRPEFAGGNIAALTGKLEYLQWLGINCVWLSPFYRAQSYHGYDITDFFSVNPRFGTLNDLQRFTEEAHRRGIRLIADFVPNHCSYSHPFFMEAQADRRSRYFEWFHFTRWPDRYLSFLGYPHLPKINLRCEAARSHIIDAARFWLSWGFDGLRLDHAIGPDLEFWKYFSSCIKKEYPECVLIGEVALLGMSTAHAPALGLRHKYRRLIFGASQERIYRDYFGVLDGVLDFQVQGMFKDYARGPAGSDEMVALASNIKRHFASLPDGFLLPVFLDNHDMDRFLYICGQDKERFRKCAQILFSLERPVIIYYGTEAGMTQEQPISSRAFHGDLLARQPMPWEHMDKDLMEFFRKLIWQRRECRQV